MRMRMRRPPLHGHEKIRYHDRLHPQTRRRCRPCRSQSQSRQRHQTQPSSTFPQLTTSPPPVRVCVASRLIAQNRGRRRAVRVRVRQRACSFLRQRCLQVRRARVVRRGQREREGEERELLLQLHQQRKWPQTRLFRRVMRENLGSESNRSSPPPMQAMQSRGVE